MNHLQQAWLKILAPVIPLVNDKLAKRSGLLGKIGKFFAFGPRQFGYHPTNKFLALINQVFLQNIPFLMHKHSFLKYSNPITIGTCPKMDTTTKDHMQFHQCSEPSSLSSSWSGVLFQENSTLKST